MSEFVKRLQNCQSSKDIEDVVVDISAEGSETLQEHKHSLVVALNSLIDEKTTPQFDINSKLRRRIKRLVATMTEACSSRSSAEANCVNYDKEADAQFEALSNKIKEANSCEDVENAVISITINDIQYNSPGLEKLHQQLNAVVNDNNLEMNAKLRRRIKRMIESIEKVNVVQDQGVDDTHYTSYIPTPPPRPDPVSTEETVRLLTTAKSIADVEYAMNSYASLPPIEHVEGNMTSKEMREAVRTAMVNVLLSPERDFLTNKKLRHRMEKAAYQLDSTAPPVKSLYKNSSHVPAKSSPPVAISTCVTSSERMQDESDAQIAITASTIRNFYTNLEAASGADDLLSAVEGIPARKEAFSTLLRNASGRTSIENENDENRFSVEKAQEFVNVINKILEENGYVKRNTQEIMSECDTIDETPDSRVNKVKLLSKTKRKMKRISDAASAAILEMENETKDSIVAPQSVVDGGVCDTSTALPPLEPIIESIRQCQSSEDIEVQLRDVKPGAGSCKSRRTLKRALERILADNLTGKLTSNCRRKMKRVLKLIEPNGNVSETVTSPDSTCEKIADSNDKKRKDGHDSEVKRPQFRLFIGQLAFSTTAADLEKYLREQGVECPLQIRMLTERETGKSRGTAFLDLFGGKRSLKRCLSLHHTMLNGRRINVEKTGKGFNDEVEVKKRRIEDKVRESEKMDALLRDFEENVEENKGGVFKVKSLSDSTMNRLYAMNMDEVRSILHEFSTICSASKSVNGAVVFRELITKRDGGGSAVDQSKGRKFGSFANSTSVLKTSFKSGASAIRDSSDSNVLGSDEVPWGFSGTPTHQVPDDPKQGIQAVFKSMRGRGGKRLTSR